MTFRGIACHCQGGGEICTNSLIQSGLETVEISGGGFRTPVTLKRKWDEIADSENVEASDDEFGWEKEDETVQTDDLLGRLR